MDEVISRLRRDFNDSDCYNYDYGCYSNWYSWGRWVFLAGVIIAFIALLAFCIIVARRRRGLTRYYGAPWMPFRPNHPSNGPQQFQTYPPQQYGRAGEYYAPPIYTPSPQMTGNHFSPNPPMQPGSPYQPHQMDTSNYPPPARNPSQSIPHHSTGGSDYYMPPPGPPPAAHVGKL